MVVASQTILECATSTHGTRRQLQNSMATRVAHWGSPTIAPGLATETGKRKISETWRDLTRDITERFHHPFEGTRALQKLRQLEYKGDIHMFLTEFNLLNQEVEMLGLTYQDEILKKLPSQVTDRIAMYENTKK